MACPPQVPISVIPPVGAGVGPLVYANGNQVARLNPPLNPSFVVYDGSKTRWGDGSATAPVLLPNLQQVQQEDINFAVGLQSNGQLAAFANLAVDPNNALVTATGSTTARTLANRFADVVNVMDFGAVGDGATDDTVAIQAAINAMGSNGSVLFFPAGEYYLNTLQYSAYPGYPFGPNILLVQSKLNFGVIGDGASLIVGNNAIQGPPSSGQPDVASCVLAIDKCQNFTINGLRIVGNRTGLISSQENVGIILTSCVNFNVSNIIISGNFGGLGAGIAADWLVDGSFNNIRMEKVGIIADVAYLQNVTFNNVIGYGADTNGSQGSGQVGNKGFSLINDHQNASINYTGVSFTYSNNVNYHNCVAENFNVGVVIATGQYINFDSCSFSVNPGSGFNNAIGIWITYYPSGNFSSVGFPVQNLAIDDCKIFNNGTGFAGWGIYIDATTVTSPDVLKNFIIGDTFVNNNNITGVEISSTTNIQNLLLINNSFSGSSQIYNYGNNILSVATIIDNDYVKFQGATGYNQSSYYKNNTALFWGDSTNAQQPIFGVSNSNVTYLRPASSSAIIALQNFAGTTVFETLGTSTLASGATAVYLLYNNGTTTSLQQVTVGAANSGGTGYRSLCVPN